MKIEITEHKSTGQRPMRCLGKLVRVFINNDYHYGVFVDENFLLDKLTKEQVEVYLAAPNSISLDVPRETAQAVLDAGISPYKKQILY